MAKNVLDLDVQQMCGGVALGPKISAVDSMQELQLTLPVHLRTCEAVEMRATTCLPQSISILKGRGAREGGNPRPG